jgi:DNA-binding MarR family transcriptional regulator
MEKDSILNQVAEYARLWREITSMYDAYAKQCGLSYAGLHVLYMLYMNEEGCTQKMICQNGFMPKQTVNSVIKDFDLKGFLNFSVMKTDRRNKIILLTDVGRKFAGGIIPQLLSYEFRAMEKLCAEQRDALLDSTQQYSDNFREAIGAIRMEKKEEV